MTPVGLFLLVLALALVVGLIVLRFGDGW